MGAVEPTIIARMGLGPISSGPLGHSRTTTVVGADGTRSTTTTSGASGSATRS